MKYDGEYLNDKKNGKGKEYNFYNGKYLFVGEFKNGERWNGYGKEYNLEGKLIFDGEYTKGKKIIVDSMKYIWLFNL